MQMISALARRSENHPISTLPLLRKYNLAHRFREFGQLTFSGYLPRTPLSLSAKVAFADDDCSKSVLGLLQSEELRYGIDLSWSLSEKAQLYANLGLQKVDAEQAGSSSFSTSDWRTRHEFIGAHSRCRSL